MFILWWTCWDLREISLSLRKASHSSAVPCESSQERMWRGVEPEPEDGAAQMQPERVCSNWDVDLGYPAAQEQCSTSKIVIAVAHHPKQHLRSRQDYTTVILACYMTEATCISL